MQQRWYISWVDELWIQVCVEPQELMDAAHTCFREVVLESFGVKWTANHQRLMDISRDHAAGDLLAEFAALLRRMRTLADAGRWPYGDALMGVQAGISRPITGLVIGGVTEHAGEPDCVVTQVLLDDEPAWPARFGERAVHSHRFRGEASTTDGTARSWLVGQVLTQGFFCRCRQLQSNADGSTCRRTADGTVPEVRLSDGTPLRCARDATDREVAALYGLSQRLPYFRHRLGQGRTRAIDVLEAESAAIKQPRRELGLRRKPGRRPQ